jgi:hypothetical protein
VLLQRAGGEGAPALAVPISSAAHRLRKHVGADHLDPDERDPRPATLVQSIARESSVFLILVLVPKRQPEAN